MMSQNGLSLDLFLYRGLDSKMKHFDDIGLDTRKILWEEKECIRRKLNINFSLCRWIHNMIFSGICEQSEEQFYLLKELLEVMKSKGASETYLRKNLEVDHIRMESCFPKGQIFEVNDFETFRVTEGGQPLRQAST